MIREIRVVFFLVGMLLILSGHVLAGQKPEGAIPKGKQEVAPSGPDTARSQSQVPQLQALRIDGKGIEIDGRLDESFWECAPAATGFVQFQPDEGAPASERTEVRVLYGERALYVGIRAFEKDPTAIEAQLTRRDQHSYSDWLYVAIDSYSDKRTAFKFSTNPKGVKRDAYLYNDTRMDYDWDAVWEVQAAIDNLGWTAEFRIPYSQLRFPRKRDLTWGIQFGREIARKEETSHWAPLSAQEYATVSKFGTLRGLNGVKPPRRLELMPYTMMKLQRAPGDTINPLFEENEFTVTLGMDMKYGVTGDLTLDVTVNPDFGQVEADPAEVNLTAFETFFPERRPFFLEGADIFDFVVGYGPTGMPDEKLFYSRRIGREPRGDVNSQGGYMEIPDATTIQIAEKLSGKTASGWTVGLLHASTAKEEAHIVTGGGQDVYEVVEPSTQYGLVRLQKDFRNGRSALGMISTGVFRRSETADAMDLHRRAVTGGIDFRHRFGGDNYLLSGYVIGTQVSGSKESIAALQQAPSRYMQRPDADHVTYDPDRTSLEGTTASLTFGKVAGAPGQYGAVIRSRTPGFEVNDMGFARRSDLLMSSAWLEYHQYVPTRYFRRYSLHSYIYYIQTQDYERTALIGDVFANLQFLNYWSLRGGVFYDLEAVSTRICLGAVRPSRPMSSSTYGQGWEPMPEKSCNSVSAPNSARSGRTIPGPIMFHPALTGVPPAGSRSVLVLPTQGMRTTASGWTGGGTRNRCQPRPSARPMSLVICPRKPSVSTADLRWPLRPICLSSSTWSHSCRQDDTMGSSRLSTQGPIDTPTGFSCWNLSSIWLAMGIRLKSTLTGMRSVSPSRTSTTSSSAPTPCFGGNTCRVPHSSWSGRKDASTWARWVTWISAATSESSSALRPMTCSWLR